MFLLKLPLKTLFFLENKFLYKSKIEIVIIGKNILFCKNQ